MAVAMAATDDTRRRDMAESLAKIRHHTASKLPNQRAPAQLLVAVETSIHESQGASSSSTAAKDLPSPTAYLLALVSILSKASQGTTPGSNDSLLPSCMYLLTLVTPHVAPGVLRAQLTALIEPLALVLSNPAPSAVPASTSTSKDQGNDSQAALLRSALGVLEPLLHALAVDRPTLSSNLPLRGCWNATLRLCLDARPKVRKRAQDLVGHILDMEPGAKAHPFATKTAEWAITALDGVGAAGSISRKGVANSTKSPAYDVKTGRAKQPEVAAAARQKHVDGGSANSGIWVCGFLRQLAPILPAKSIPPLCANLLRLLSQKNPYLSTAAFEVFESLFRIAWPVSDSAALTTLSLGGSADAAGSGQARNINADALVTTLDALSSSSVQPSSSDVQLVAPYLRALESAMVAYSRIDAGKAAWARVPAIWNSVTSLALSSQSKASRDSTAVRGAGRDVLCALARYCIPDTVIEEAVEGRAKTPPPALVALLTFFEEALSSNTLRYSHAWAEIMSVLASFVLRLRFRPSGKRSAATKRVRPAAAHLLIPHVKTVGLLRSQPKFEHREQADAVIGAAVQVCGPATILDALPLGLFGENGAQGGRAWLLPLMRSNITNTELAHFAKFMIPLSETLFNKQAEAEEPNEEGKPKAPIQAKVYEALTEQIWALLPGYCDLPIDLIKALDPQFVELLANVLYSQPMLRASVCRALQLLVERSTSLSKSAAPPEMLEDSFGLAALDGKRCLAHLAAIAPNLLAVLFNIFSQSPGESRSYLSECMVAYLGILPHDEVAKTYEKIVSTFENALPTLEPAKDRETGPKSVPPIPHTMLDLLILLVPFTTLREAKMLYALVTQEGLLAARDAGLQKKTYRLLARLMEGAKATQVLEVGQDKAGKLPELLGKLQDTGKNVVAGAKRDRTSLLASLVPVIPSSELHVMPSLVPEAVLATKEVNQGARELAYRLLVEMGRKMESGGQIKRHLVEGAVVDEDDDMANAPVVKANLTEFITMVAAGLAGSSPHMISATITALARLLYEFHQQLPNDTLSELVATMDIFLESPNREVVKSTLGFVKVAIVSLPADVVDPNLPGTVKALLSSNAHHRMHFKSKIRHIFERLLRRFGYERIEALTDDENRKLLVNIRKRKERAKRKKVAQIEEGGMVEEEEEEDAVAAGAGQKAAKDYGADAFEEAIYGSESELSDSDNDADDEAQGRTGRAGAARNGKSNRQSHAAAQDYLLADDDAPMDLLDRSIAAGGRVTVNKGKAPANRKRQPGQEASHFALDDETGRMVIEDPDEPDTDEDEQGGIDVEGAGRAYMDRERGTHGMTTKDGVVRLNKNNKRNREADAAMEEEQVALEEQLAALVAKQQQAAATGGSASVASTGGKKRKQERKTIGNQFRAKKAGGDIKRGEQSPYAYVPLGDVGAKSRRPGGGGGGGKGGNMRFLSKNKRPRS